ncbi:hypothetical protein [Moraxella marmotae]|uniref:hypothetical protein n=1 Tax=Moraxella marmotae TaxID=3344520 RepID=UPI0035F40AAD
MPHHAFIAQQFHQAIRQANFSVRLGLLAMVCFCVFGTLASLSALHDNAWVYYAFHYLPYVLIAMTMPASLYHSFLLMRYKVVDLSILGVILATGLGLLGFVLVRWLIFGTDMAFFMGLFLAMIAWFGMPFLFRVNLQKFANFLDDKAKHDKSATTEAADNPTLSAQSAKEKS